MAKKRHPLLPSWRKSKPRARPTQQMRLLLLRRDQRVAEIENFRLRFQPPGQFVETAYTLLTRSWGRADWKGREEILRAVDWLWGLRHMRPVSSGKAQREKAEPLAV